MLQYTPTTDTTETLNIEMLHPLERPSRFFQRLQITVKQAVTMRGAIAFWTVKPNFVVQNFAQLLAADESFICVDLHQPTNIDVLDELLQNVQCHDQNQQHVYLHLRELKGQTEEHGSNTNMPHDLLHLKTLLFDFTDGTAEIWVGSHNWTRRAMLGLNIEATVVLRVPQGGQLYNDTKQMLEQTRALCEPFAPRLKKFYKWLQGGMQPVPFFELEGPNASKLTNEEIKLFSLVEGEYASFGTIGRQIYLCVTDSNEGTEHIYNAALTTASDSAGDIADKEDSTQISHSDVPFPS